MSKKGGGRERKREREGGGEREKEEGGGESNACFQFHKHKQYHIKYIKCSVNNMIYKFCIIISYAALHHMFITGNCFILS